MHAIKDLKEELRKVQEAQWECVAESGYIINSKRYRYKELMRVAKELKGAIDWLEKLYK